VKGQPDASPLVREAQNMAMAGMKLAIIALFLEFSVQEVLKLGQMAECSS